MYSCLIFDVDGTLLDTQEIILKTLQQVIYEETRQDYPLDQLRFAMWETSQTTLTRLHVPNIDRANQKWIKYIQTSSNQIKPFIGIQELLRAIKQKRIPLGIVTSKTTEELKTDFVALGLSSYFQTIITADMVTKTKPHPEALHLCLDRLGHPLKETLYIGDAVFDSQAAQAIGLDFALALWGRADHTIQANHYLSSPEELLKLISI